MIAQHDRAADAAAALSGASFLTAHWFLVTDKLLHMGAEVVSIGSGLAAAAYYMPVAVRRAKAVWARMRGRQ